MDRILMLAYELIVSLVPCLLFFLILHTQQRKKGRSFNGYQIAAVLSFFIYVAAVFHFTGAGTIFDGFRYGLEIKAEQLNFIPFSQNIDIVAYLLNILLFIPIGVLVPMICRKIINIIDIVGISFFFTGFVEFSQLLNHRRTDIDDIFLNVLGGVIGCVFYKLLNHVMKSKLHLKSISALEVVIYIVFIFVGRFVFFNEIGLAKILYGF